MKIFLTSSLAALLLCLGWDSPLFASESEMAVEMYASDQDGNPLDGEFQATFCISESSAERDCLVETTETATFRGGVHQALLNLESLAGQEIPPTAFLWIEIGDQTLEPLALASVLWSFSSQVANRALSADVAQVAMSVADTNLGPGLVSAGGSISIDTSTVPQLSLPNIFSTSSGPAITVRPSIAVPVDTKLVDIGQGGNGPTVLSIDSEGDIAANSLDLLIPLADSEIADALTVVGGTINDTIIGALTPAQATVTGLITKAQQAISIDPFGTNAGDTGEVHFLELGANGSDYVGLKAPDTIGAGLILTLPSTAGSPGEVLSTDGSGILSWSAPTVGSGGGDITGVTAGTGLTGGGGSGGVTLSVDVGTTAGKILQLDGAGKLPAVDASQLTGVTLGNNSITGSQILDDSILASDIASDAVTSSKIANGAVSAAKIASDAIDASKIAADAVGSSEIVSGAVGTDEIAAAAITTAKIVNGAIDASKIAANAIGASHIDASVAGAGLTGGNGSALAIGAGSGITVSADGISVDTSAIPSLSSANEFSAAGTAITIKPGSAPAADTTLFDVEQSAGGSVFTIDAEGDVAAHSLSLTTPLTDAAVSDALTVTGGLIDSTAIGSVTPSAGTFTSLLTKSQNALTLDPFGTNAGETGEIRLKELTANGAAHVGIKAPDAVTSDLILTLPSTAGSSGDVLSTDGTGVLSWMTPNSGSGGDITGVTAGTGLTGGGGSGSITLNVDVGTSAGNIVQLDGSGRLPAVDASQLTGVAPAADSVTGSAIADGSISASDIADGAINASKIAADAVGSSQIANDAVGAAEIAADAVGSSEIAANAVGSAELADGAVITAKIANNAVDASKIAANSVGASQINAAVAGAGLTGGGGSPLAVGAGNGITVSADTISVDTSSIPTLSATNEFSASGTAIRVKPGSTPAADTALIDLQDAGGSSIFHVDYEGDVFGNTLNLNVPLADSDIADALTITGGTIENTVIGSSTPAAATVTELVTKSQRAVVLDPFGTGAGNTGEMHFQELAANGAHYVGLKAPDAVASDIVWTLPSIDGTAGDLLTTDGSGMLTWSTPTSSAGGDVTGVSAGTGLTGGGSSGDITLNVDVGTTAGKIVQLDGSGKLPALDASQLTGVIPAANSVNSGTITDDTISSADIAANAIDTSEIADGAITASKIATDAVGSSQIAADAVGASEIATDAVGSAEIASNAVGVSEISGAIAGAGLIGGGGSALAIGAGSGIAVSADAIAVDTAAIPLLSATNEFSAVGTAIKIKPGSAPAANTVLLDAQSASGSSVFNVDYEGDVVANSLDLIVALADSEVTDALTISGGTVNNTPIGNSTPSTGVFTQITTTSQNAISLSPFGTGAGNTGEARFKELTANGANYVGLKSPDTLASDVIWTLPTADGTAGYLLKTDGAGNLSWVAPTVDSGGDITAVTAGTGLTGGGATGAITLNVDVGTAAGKIVQLDGSAKLPAVDGSQLTGVIPAANSVNSAKIADDTITAADIAASGVNTSEIADGAVTSIKIGTDAVGSSQIATDAVGASEIIADAVGSSEIATDAVGATEIATDAVGSSEIAADAVTSSEIAADAVDASEIAASAVGVSEISSAIAGAGLTGGGGSALAVGAGTGITVSADAISVDTSAVPSLSGTNEFTGTGTAIRLKPSSAPAANTAVLDVQQNTGSTIFKVDAEGDVTANSLTASAGVTVGSGGDTATMTRVLSKTATLNFPSRLVAGCDDLTVTVNGAALGDVVYLGVPNGSMPANYAFTAWVSATNTVTVRSCSVVAVLGDPASGTFRVAVMQF